MAKKKKNRSARGKAGKKIKKQIKKQIKKKQAAQTAGNTALITIPKVEKITETTFSKKLEEVISQSEGKTKKGLFGGRVIILGPPAEYLNRDWKGLWKRFIRGLIKLSIVLGILVAVAALMLLSEVLADGRIFPRVNLAGQRFGLMDAAEAQNLLTKKIEDFQQSSLTVIYGGEQITVPLKELDIVFSPDVTVKQLPSFHLKQNSFIELIASFFSEKTVMPIYKKDDRAIFNLLEQKLKLADKRARSAAFYLDDQKNLQIRPEQEGIIIDHANLTENLRQRLASLDNSPLTITTLREIPVVTVSDLEQEKDDLLLKMENLITIKHQDQTWKFKTLDHLDKISFRRQNDQTVIVPSDVLVNDYFQKEIFDSVEKPVSNLKIFYDEKDQITFEGKSLNGREVNRPKFVADLEMAINSLDPEVELLVEDKIATLEVDPKLQELGIKELLGTGHTAFAGSPSNRRHNIQNAMNKFNGVLIKPGETFSFNKQLGEVDGSTGYKLELVIKAEGTVPEYGGGVCQVSSTFFKAALFTGLPIVERAPHSYAVSYYAQVDGYGLDSTIYPGVRDLQFTNDTPANILIQTVIDGDDAYVNFFGTSDGRSVRLENYWRGNYRGAGGTVLIPTKTLPPGARKQIESAHGGFDASWDRIITKNGQEIKENIYSVYRATSNRILVGEEKPAA